MSKKFEECSIVRTKLRQGGYKYPPAGIKISPRPEKPAKDKKSRVKSSYTKCVDIHIINSDLL